MNRVDSLPEFQELVGSIYRVTNDRCYDNGDILSYVGRHITQIVKAVRKGNFESMGYHICMGFSWTLAFANRLHVCVQEEMFSRFPGVCPYCSSKPCSCVQRNASRQIIQRPTYVAPILITDWQEMFAAIYPQNTLQDSAMHLAEEIAELSEATRNYRNYLTARGDEYFHKMVEELIDVLTHFFGVATGRKLDLAANLARYFNDGCPKCKQFACTCGYVIVDEPI